MRVPDTYCQEPVKSVHRSLQGSEQVREQDPRVPLKLQIEMEWFEKHVYTPGLLWEQVAGDDKNDAARTITTAGDR